MSGQGAGVDLGNLNYTVQDPYNGTIASGGDSLLQNLNVFYQVGNSARRHVRVTVY